MVMAAWGEFCRCAGVGAGGSNSGERPQTSHASVRWESGDRQNLAALCKRCGCEKRGEEILVSSRRPPAPLCVGSRGIARMTFPVKRGEKVEGMGQSVGDGGVERALSGLMTVGKGPGGQRGACCGVEVVLCAVPRPLAGGCAGLCGGAAKTCGLAPQDVFAEEGLASALRRIERGARAVVPRWCSVRTSAPRRGGALGCAGAADACGLLPQGVFAR